MAQITGSAVDLYIFGWDGKQLQARSLQVKAGRTRDLGNVLKHLEAQDKRYSVGAEFATNFRVRVCWREYFTTDQQDSSIVYSFPPVVSQELPFFLSFTLKEGNIIPSKKLAMQRIESPVWQISSLEVFENAIVYAHCQRQNMPDGVAFGSELYFKLIRWQADAGDKQLWNVAVFPNYHPETDPFAVAIDHSYGKLVLLNTQSKAILELAVLKRNHQKDQIYPPLLITSTNLGWTVHFVTFKY